MEEYLINSSVEPGKSFPTGLCESVWMGKGGVIRIDPKASPSKILWELRQIIRGLAIGFQWHNVKKLKARGMHGEHAEAHVTAMLNKLIGTEVPPIPSKDELAIMRAEAKLEDGENGSNDQVSQQDIP